MLPQFLKRLSLNIKLNAMLVVAFVLLLVALVTITGTGFVILLDEVSTEQVQQDVSILEQHFADHISEVMNAAKLLASAPGLVEAIEAGDTTQLRAAILLQGETLGLDDIEVINANDEHLLALVGTSEEEEAEVEQQLFGLALIGAETIGLVPVNDELMLTGFVPVKNAIGTIVGAVQAGIFIDAAFMGGLNFDRDNPNVAFIYEGEVVAQTENSGEKFGEIDEDGAYIAQALRGQLWTSEGLINDANETPDSLAYIPVTVGGQVQAVMALRNEYETLVNFQGVLIARNLIAVGVLSLLGLTATAFFLRQSVTRPLDSLKVTAEKIASGDLKQRVNIQSQDEMGQLAQSFNTMAAQIEQRIVETQAARDQAERSDQVKSAFLASMSHELRTPLNAVINFTRFVIDGDTGPVNEEQSDLLTEVVASAKHLLNLINDVLDMSKIEAGSLTLFIEENVSMNSLLNSTVKTGQALLIGKPVRLHTDIEENLPYIRADQQRITQILLNIVSNACKFTDEGDINIRAYRTNDDIMIEVKDTGSGIAPEDQSLVFEAFKQTSSGLRQAGGTGLGMPIAKSLAEAHGGRLWLDSEYGKGTTFYVAIPIKSKELMPVMA